MTGNQFTSQDDGVKANPTPKKPKTTVGILTQILNGDFLSKDFVLNNMLYFLFIFFLLFLVVAKGYYGKQVLKDIQENRKELDQNTSDYIDAKTRLEEITRRYKMAEKLLKRELVESQNAIKVIKSKDLKHE